MPTPSSSTASALMDSDEFRTLQKQAGDSAVNVGLPAVLCLDMSCHDLRCHLRLAAEEHARHLRQVSLRQWAPTVLCRGLADSSRQRLCS